MGVKNSHMSWVDCNPPSPKPRTSGCCHRLDPPSYNHNWTALHYAASQGHALRLGELLAGEEVASLDQPDYYGKTVLYWAAYKGHYNCVRLLLKHHAKVNTRCCHGATPLHTVVSLYPDCARLLIKHGADVNCEDKWGVTPMYLAATALQLDVMVDLALAGARLSYRSKKTGKIPKQLASQPAFCEYLQALERNPLSLRQLSRIVIRQQLGEHPDARIQQLPLPAPMRHYLAFIDFR